MNLHTHTHYCDGKSSIKEIWDAAVHLNWQFLGYSSHAPLPFDCKWAISDKKIQNYCNEINELRKYKSDTLPFAGWEIDYLNGIGFPSLKSKYIYNADFFICSLHFLKSPLKKHGYIEIDGTLLDFIRCLSGYENSIEMLMSAYFNDLHKMLTTFVPATKIIGHIDKFLLNANKVPAFHQYEKKFNDMLLEWLEQSISEDVIIEVNTRCIYKYNWIEPYPGITALKYMSEKNIPCVISSDAHHHNELDLGFEHVYKICKERKINLNFINKQLPDIIKNNRNAVNA